ncbi:MAG: cupredoxin domain-containing protein [Actinomycetota bacterium]
MKYGNLAAVLVLLLGACSSGEDEATGPYVVVAVDNHFHDIHPADDIAIAADRAFVVRNEGRNLHNFSVAGTDISDDIRPGKELRFDPIGETLDPGSYEVFCKYHASVDMKGAFTVTE